MKKLLYVLALLCLSVPAEAQILGTVLPCNQSWQTSQGAAGPNKIVSASSPSTPLKIISICGWTINAGAAAGTAQLTQGFLTNCGTQTSVITPAYSLAINGVLVDHPPFAFFSLSPGADLCLTTTGTGPMQIEVFFTIN